MACSISFVSLFFNKYPETSDSIAFLIYASSSCIVNTIILVFSVDDKIFLLAVNPSNPPDNDKSINTISGSYLIAILTASIPLRSEEHTSELQSRGHLVCRLLLDKKK